jgi:hypothetical protein
MCPGIFNLESIDEAILQTILSNGIGTDSFYGKFCENKFLKEKFAPYLLSRLNTGQLESYFSENQLCPHTQN